MMISLAESFGPLAAFHLALHRRDPILVDPVEGDYASSAIGASLSVRGPYASSTSSYNCPSGGRNARSGRALFGRRVRPDDRRAQLGKRDIEVGNAKADRARGLTQSRAGRRSRAATVGQVRTCPRMHL